MKILMTVVGDDDQYGSRLEEIVNRIVDETASGLEIERAAGEPGLIVSNPGSGTIRYRALPEGHEEAPFRELLGLGPEPALAERLEGLAGKVKLMVFVASACPNCPEAVRAACRIAISCPAVETTIIDAQIHAGEAEKHGAGEVPLTILDGTLYITGVAPIDALVDLILNRGTPEFNAAALASLVEHNRLREAAALIGGDGGFQAFIDVWARSSTGSRIGMMMVAGEMLESDPAGLDGVIPGIFKVLESDDPALKGDTIDLLGQVGSRDAIPALEPLKNDPNPEVAEIAAEIVEELEQDGR